MFYHLGLFRLGFEHPTSRLRGNLLSTAPPTRSAVVTCTGNYRDDAVNAVEINEKTYVSTFPDIYDGIQLKKKLITVFAL